jgi:peroxiredoxin
MTTLKRSALFLVLGFLIILIASAGMSLDKAVTGQPAKGAVQEKSRVPEEKIHVVLHRVDNIKPWSATGFDFEKTDVAEVLKKYPVKLPDPLPAGTELGYSSGPTYALKQPVPGAPKIRLTIDVNANYDLRDDTALELTSTDKMEEWTEVKIARPFGGPFPRTEWLSYLVGYEQSKGRDGKIQDSVYFAPYYNFQGEFHLGKYDYTLVLDDGDARGRFIREKLANVNIFIRVKDDTKPSQGHRFFELIPIEDALYEVKDFAEDGSWIDFVKSVLPVTALGKAAPDIEMTDSAGAKFHIADYRGKLLVLDFWYVWCKPCIAKFPDIKKTIERISGKPFAAIGINIDEAVRVEQAKKVIADYQLTWRQVVEGKGEFIPVYQVYGRLPERPMSFPIYVAIDEGGTTRYATNDFLKMERFLDAHFNDPKGPDHTLFVPCSEKYGLTPEPRPTIKVDFTSQKVLNLLHSGRLKLPEGLPKDARAGLLPNGTAIVVYAGPTAGKIRLVADADQDLDMTKEKGYDIPIMNEPTSDASKMVEADLRVHWASGGIAFLGMPFYAKPGPAGMPPEVFGLGQPMRFEGTFFVGKAQYALEIADLNGDRLLTGDDTAAPGFLKLKMKKGDDWVLVHEGTSRIPIDRSLYRLKFVSDDGFLVELEKEKGEDIKK